VFQLSLLERRLLGELDHDDLIFWSRGNIGFDVAELLESPLLEGSATT
jgi:hypothetical protein